MPACDGPPNAATRTVPDSLACGSLHAGEDIGAYYARRFGSQAPALRQRLHDSGGHRPAAAGGCCLQALLPRLT